MITRWRSWALIYRKFSWNLLITGEGYLYSNCSEFCKKNIKRDLVSVLSNCQGFIKDTKRTRVRLDRRPTTMQQADYHRHRPTPRMQESMSMHKSPIPLRHSRMNQARSEEEEKETKRDRKDRGQEVDGKKGSSTKQKHIGGTKTRPTYLVIGWGYRIL